MTEKPAAGSWESAPLPPGLPPGHEPSDGGGTSPRGEGAALVAWEDPAQGNEIERFLRTLRDVLTAPVEAFDKVGASEALGRPIAFGMIVTTLAQLAQAAYQALFGSLASLVTLLTAHGAATPRPSVFGGASETAVQFALAIFTPIFFVLGLVISGAVFHVGLMIFGGANRSFNQTLRALSYATATNVLAFVPIVGPLLGGLWAMALHVIGLARVHRTTYAKSALAVFAPTLLACACGVALIAAFAGILFAALRPLGRAFGAERHRRRRHSTGHQIRSTTAPGSSKRASIRRTCEAAQGRRWARRSRTNARFSASLARGETLLAGTTNVRSSRASDAGSVSVPVACSSKASPPIRARVSRPSAASPISISGAEVIGARGGGSTWTRVGPAPPFFGFFPSSGTSS